MTRVAEKIKDIVLIKDKVQSDGEINRGKLFKERKKLLNEKCKLTEVSSNLLKHTPVTKAFFYSPEAKLVVCKVPKIGSTFWARVFAALEGETTARRAFQLDRYQVHDGKYEIGFVFAKEAQKRGSKICVAARNPYTRLFSAYLDKIYLLSVLNQQFGRQLKKGLENVGKGKCGFAVSFQEFLDILLNSAAEDIFDDHYSPVTRLCNPCDLNPDYVIKQETMTTDAEFILDELKKARNTSHVAEIKDSIRNTDVQIELRQLIKTVMIDRKKFRVECPQLSLLMQKVWKALQLQGIIHEESDYPGKEVTSLQQSKQFEKDITSIIMRELEQKPVSLKQMLFQRHNSVVDAYRGIHRYTIGRIKLLYKLDFVLFGYDPEPPEFHKTFV